MVIHHHVEGYDNFCKFMQDFDTKGKDVYIMFSGSKLPNGINWCSDCIEAKPVVDEALKKYAHANVNFIYVEVGDRATFKDVNCSFRKDDRIRLTVIPTVMKWGTPMRLEGVEQCGKLDLLELLFLDE